MRYCCEKEHLDGIKSDRYPLFHPVNSQLSAVVHMLLQIAFVFYALVASGSC